MDEYDELMDLCDAVDEGPFDKDDYNSIPVYYCKLCLSLKIRNIPDVDNSDFCDDCCSADIGITNIDEWDKLYLLKYNKKFINNGREKK